MPIKRQLLWEEIESEKFALVNRGIDYVDQNSEIWRGRIQDVAFLNDLFIIDLAYLTRLVDIKKNKYVTVELDPEYDDEIRFVRSQFNVYLWTNGEITIHPENDGPISFSNERLTYLIRLPVRDYAQTES